MNSESRAESESAEDRQRPEDDREERESGEDGGSSAPVPFAPDKNDDTPLGDTDQHSDA